MTRRPPSHQSRLEAAARTPARIAAGHALKAFVCCAIVSGCASSRSAVCLPVGQIDTSARSADGEYISWREHVIDDEIAPGVPLTGGDGLMVTDLDRDGHEDVVSVHESDSEYDGIGDGYVRVAYGKGGSVPWQNVTLAKGEIAGAPEDIAVGDLNGDGWPDIVIASELAHLLYLQNPGTGRRSEAWPALIVPITEGRGSWIRVFIADIDGDSRLEVIAANKGVQDPDGSENARTPISIFEVSDDPMLGTSWSETELGRFDIPHNARPVDLDGDGDLDILAGLRGTGQVGLFVNDGSDFHFHVLDIDGAWANAFMVQFTDFNSDGRLDILAATDKGLAWLQQPAELTDQWVAHIIGDFAPDKIAGLQLADIDGDGVLDIIAGGYSDEPRNHDEVGDLSVAMGRIGWFENVGEGAFVGHDISRRRRGMFDAFIARDIDNDGDADFFATRGNSEPFDGLIWLEQVRTPEPRSAFQRARLSDSPEQALCR